MRDTDDLQISINVRPVNCQGQTLSLELGLEMALPLPSQDEHLPDLLEAAVHRVGIELQRRLFQVLIEKADHELVLQQRHGKGGDGLQCRGTRPYTFKTLFGEVTVRRTRVCHKRDGSMEIPSARAWGTPHQLAITQNLRDAVCDRMGDQSARQSRTDIGQSAGDEELLGLSTILEIVHQEGERLMVAQRQRAQSILDGGSEAQLALLGLPAEEAVTDELSDVPPCDESEEDQAEWERVQAEWVATGFPGSEPRSRSRSHGTDPAKWIRDS